MDARAEQLEEHAVFLWDSPDKLKEWITLLEGYLCELRERQSELLAEQQKPKVA